MTSKKTSQYQVFANTAIIAATSSLLFILCMYIPEIICAVIHPDCPISSNEFHHEWYKIVRSISVEFIVFLYLTYQLCKSHYSLRKLLINTGSIIFGVLIATVIYYLIHQLIGWESMTDVLKYAKSPFVATPNTVLAVLLTALSVALKEKNSICRFCTESILLAGVGVCIRMFLPLYYGDALECLMYIAFTCYVLGHDQASGKRILFIASFIVLGRLVPDLLMRLLNPVDSKASLVYALMIYAGILAAAFSCYFRRISLSAIMLLLLVYLSVCVNPFWTQQVLDETQNSLFQVDLFLVLFCAVSMIALEEIYRYKLKEKDYLKTIVHNEVVITSLYEQLTETEITASQHKKDLSAMKESVSTYQDFTRNVLLKFYFSESSAFIDSSGYSLLVDAYASSSPSKKEFLQILKSNGITLSQREKMMCILYREKNGGQSDFPSILGTTGKESYSSAKSRLKKKLKGIVNPAPEVVQLIKTLEQTDKYSKNADSF